MSKLTLNNVGSLIDATTAANTINSNNTKVVTAFNNTLSRDGASPNQMAASIDMNSNRILNLPAAENPGEPVRKSEFDATTFGNYGILNLEVKTPGATAVDTTDSATLVRIFDGSLANPHRSVTPSVAISRYDAMSSATLTGGAPALLVETIANGSGSGNPNSASIIGNVFQYGIGDVVGVVGQATMSGSGIHFAYGGFFAANTTVSTGQAFGLESIVLNNSGTNETYAGNAQTTALHLGSDGSKRAGAAIWVKSNTNPGFDVGMALAAGSVKTVGYQDDSSSVTILKATGTHTNGIDLSGATLTTSAFKSNGFNVNNLGVITITDGTVTGAFSSSALFTHSTLLNTLTNHNLVFGTNNTLAGYFDTSQNLNLGSPTISRSALVFNGFTTGAVSIKPQDTAGTYNFNLPITAGTSGQTLTSAGGGSAPMTWSNAIIGTVSLTGDVTGSGTNTIATTLATVNTNVGTFGSTTQSGVFTVNGKGLITAASNATITIAVGAITGLGTGIAAFLSSPTSANIAAAITDETGTGSLVFATSPTLVTPNLGTPATVVLTNATGTAASLTSGNVTTNANLTGPITSAGNATSIASQTGTGTKFVVDASPTLTGTPLTTTASVDTNTTQIASTAFVIAQAASATPLINGTATVGTSTRFSRGDHIHPTDTTRAPLASPTFTGTVTYPTPFTLGAVSVTTTGTQLNYLSAATGTTGTTSTNVVFSTSPTLVTPVLGVATATSINKVTITAPATSAVLTIADGTTLTETTSTSIGQGQYLATATNDNATAGNIGEYRSASNADTDGAQAGATITVTIASPAVVTWSTTTPFVFNGNGTAVINFTTTGALPTGIVAGTNYYVIGSSVSGNTFQIATSADNAIAGTAINTSGSQSGTHTGVPTAILTDNTASVVAAMSLTAGDWYVSSDCAFFSAASTVITVLSSSIALVTTGTTVPGRLSQLSYPAGNILGVSNTVAHVGSSRFSLNATTTIYAVVKPRFTTSTLASWGGMRAIRRR